MTYSIKRAALFVFLLICMVSMTVKGTANGMVNGTAKETGNGAANGTDPELPAQTTCTILAAKYTDHIKNEPDAEPYVHVLLRRKEAQEVPGPPTHQIEWYLICDTENRLYMSEDLKTKRLLCTFPDALSYKFGIRQNGDIIAVYRSEFSKAVTTDYGPSLDQVRRDPYVLLQADDYAVLHKVEFGDYDASTGEGLKPCGWVENCGFCSLPNGDVMFAEYTRMGIVYTANCWRIKAGADSTDPASWEIVKQFRVAENDRDQYDESVIEHFHTVQMDPYSGIVYIATGDTKNKAQMWYSRDNGDSWTQQKFVDPYDWGTATSGERLFRILNYNFTEEYVYWSSDSSRDHAILRCTRSRDGGLDPDSVTVMAELPRLEGAPATYGTVLLEDEELMVLMERCDAKSRSMLFRVFDLRDNTVKTVCTIGAAGDSPVNLGFRTEYTEFEPSDGVIKVGFGSQAKYRNTNDLCGNAGKSDWSCNINNMWIRVYRNPDGGIEAEFGYYPL